MSDNVSKLMHLEQLIVEFLDENNDVDDSIIEERFINTHYVDKCISLLKRMNNNDVIESLKRFEYIRMFVDFKVFLKKYIINKKSIKENPQNCLLEYNKLNSICQTISEVSENRKEFISYLQILDVNTSNEWLLCHMPNEDLMKLANDSTDWTEKLYYYSYLKKE